MLSGQRPGGTRNANITQIRWPDSEHNLLRLSRYLCHKSIIVWSQKTLVTFFPRHAEPSLSRPDGPALSRALWSVTLIVTLMPLVNIIGFLLTTNPFLFQGVWKSIYHYDNFLKLLQLKKWSTSIWSILLGHIQIVLNYLGWFDYFESPRVLISVHASDQSVWQVQFSIIVPQLKVALEIILRWKTFYFECE